MHERKCSPNNNRAEQQRQSRPIAPQTSGRWTFSLLGDALAPVPPGGPLDGPLQGYIQQGYSYAPGESKCTPFPLPSTTLPVPAQGGRRVLLTLSAYSPINLVSVTTHQKLDPDLQPHSLGAVAAEKIQPQEGKKGQQG